VAAVPRPAEIPTLDVFLARLAEGSPTPGGGAAVALTVSMAAALTSMVARVTLKYAAGDRELDDVAVAADSIREKALAGVFADARAFTDVVAARRAGGDVQAALMRATEAPLGIARLAREILDLVATLSPRARPSAASDLVVGAGLAATAVRGAARTARANLVDIADRSWATRVDTELVRLVDDAAALERRACEEQRA